tara:strand:- start:1067 stop:1231 length:165 start_codon:yes stop_codon:yes gene_type:complete
MSTLKTLWYIRKAKIYEALVQKMTKLRGKIKAEQCAYQKKADHYKGLIKERTKI